MNRHFYRIIFNKARGMLMVVADIAKTNNGYGRTSHKVKNIVSDSVIATLKPIAFLTYIALGIVGLMSPVHASTIIADTSANKNQQPTVINTANGVTQVNIQTPSAAGVSHNKFTQFDISESGAILNNSNKASQTQLAGYVKGNEFLATTGGAKIILNEVNAKNSSQLNGYIEVAGQKAQVIIANAAGITCNGCGFINANRATLTTGKPLIENGDLKGYQVDKGHIAIEGKGMDSSRQDYTDLISQTASLNAGLWANNAKIVTGRNKVSRDLNNITKLADNDDVKPQLALDVSALGGMYAGKIELIGTQSGVGVHNAGHLGASVGSITITVDGKIVNSGSIQANDNVSLVATQNINNQKNIYAKEGNVTLDTQASLTNQGTIVAQHDVSLSAKNSIESSVNSTIAAGVNSAGKLTQSGQIIVEAKNALLQGKNLSNEAIVIHASDLVDLSQSQTVAQSVTVAAKDIQVQSANDNTPPD